MKFAQVQVIPFMHCETIPSHGGGPPPWYPGDGQPLPDTGGSVEIMSQLLLFALGNRTNPSRRRESPLKLWWIGGRWSITLSLPETGGSVERYARAFPFPGEAGRGSSTPSGVSKGHGRRP